MRLQYNKGTTFGKDIRIIYENIFEKSIPFGQMARLKAKAKAGKLMLDE